MELSKRLQAVADMVSKGKCVADIGTDHGYIPIYLIQSNIAKKVYAMDVNQGPYMRAKNHVAAHKLENQIETRLSDGMRELKLQEANSIIIAGMGGGLVIKILDQDKRLWESIDELILQPQSEIGKVRAYLQRNGWKAVAEDMVLEDGKFYPLMKMIKGEEVELSAKELEYGRLLLQKKHRVLKKFVEKEIKVKVGILSKIESSQEEKIRERARQLKKELGEAYEVLGDL